MKNLPIAVVALTLASCASSPQSEGDNQANISSPELCEKLPGMVQGPYVPGELTARKIAEAVIAALPHSRPQDEYSLKIEDQDKYWAAWESWMPTDRKVGDSDGIVVYARGGGIQMLIAKCDGAISELHYQR